MSILALIIVSLYIAYTDKVMRRISNVMVLTVAFLSLTSTGSIVFAPIPYLIAAIIGLFLFAANLVAGGDIKLMLAFLPAIDLHWWFTVFILTTSIGGVMALGYLTYGLLTKQLDAVRKRGLPYGVPIAISGTFGVWLTSLPT